MSGEHPSLGPSVPPGPAGAYGQYGQHGQYPPSGQYGAYGQGGAAYGQYGQYGAYGQYPSYGAPYGSYTPVLPYASWWSRVGACLLDGLLVMVPVFVFVLAGVATDLVVLIVLGIVAAFGIGAWTVVDQGRTGQSWGKRVSGIAVLREADGLPLGVPMSFVRAIAHYLFDGLCYVGYLMPLWHSKKQTFADMACSTVVIRVG